ncbi:MAG: thioredoxin domain-containing protein [Acidobacteria bacterium]|nr:thioredoxin domain-containing protein [Acidobacteriota bacterium]
MQLALRGLGVASIVFALACSTQGAPQGSAAPAAAGSKQPLAVVGGVEITEADLDIQGELLRLEQEIYQVKNAALEEAIAAKLIEQEAKRRGVTVEELEAKEVRSKVQEPSDLAVEAFYEQQKARIRQPLENVRDQVKQLLTNIQERDARKVLVDSLRAGADVKVMLDPPRLPVNLDSAPMRGSDKAPVLIVEFSDFQCPFCRRVQPTLSELQTKYGDKLRWSFKDLPLVSIHPEAMKAAEAARCAGDQGKFWEYRAKMFATSNISAGLHQRTAEELGLDVPKFESCVASGEYADEVQADSDEAAAMGISGTPAFLINGVLLSGAQPLEAFEEVIDRELQKAGL